MSKRELRQKLSKETLYKLYCVERKSLGDIAKDYGVSRVAIMYYCNVLNIPLRTKSQARIEAQKQGKLPQRFFDINERFFSSWSTEMAYVLGLIITDGCMSKTGTISLCMNDKDLLEKVKKVMGAAHKIELSKYQKNLHIFHFARENMVKDLNNLGVIPQKSLRVTFPRVPQKYLSDFIRGIFDGDGSIYFDKRSKNCPIRTTFYSGSKDFIEKLEDSLTKLGMSKRKISQQKTKNGIYYGIRYSHKNSLKLFSILYKDTGNGLFLERKYVRFLESLKGGISDGKGT